MSPMNKTAVENAKLQLEKRGQDLNRQNVKTTARYRLAGDAIKAAGSIIPKASFKLGAQDPEWYKQFVKDLNKFTNLNVFYRLGEAVDDEDHPLFKSNSVQQRVPGVMSINFIPSIGSQERLQSAVALSDSQQSFNMFLTQMRKLNSRVGEYEPTEIGLALNCTVDLASMIERVGWALKVAITFDGENRYIGDGLLLAAGFDADDIRTNRAKYLQEHDILVAQFNSNIVIPVDLSILKRRVWMHNLILKDCGSRRSQLYIFKQMFYHVFDDVNNGTNVYEMPLSGQVISLSTFISQIKIRYEAILNSPTLTVMYSDMRAAFEDSKLFKLYNVNSTDECSFVESDEIMQQIHNLDTAYNLYDITAYVNPNSIKLHTSTDGYLYQGTETSARTGISITYEDTSINVFNKAAESGYINGSKKFMNFYQEPEYITGDDILVSTRLMSIPHFEQEGDNVIAYYTTTGTEVVFNMTIYDILANNNSGITFNATPIYKYYIDASLDDYEKILVASSLVSTFNEHPIIFYLTGPLASTPIIKDFFTFGEVENYLTISNSNLTQLHKACVMSEYYVDIDNFNRNK
nr:putative capsid protein [Picobirnavirus sp.]